MLQEENKAIAEDKFLVQLAPVPDGADLTAITLGKDKDTMNELNKLWNAVTKNNMVQFKLKVQRRKQDGQAPAPTNTGAQIASQATVYGDSVAESGVFQSNIEKSGTGNKDQQLYDEFDRLKKRLQQLQQDRIEQKSRLSQLQKLEDNKDFEQRKKSAIPGAGGKTADKSKNGSSTGYSFFHLLLVALISLLIGAIMTQQTQTRLFKEPVPVVMTDSGSGTAEVTPTVTPTPEPDVAAATEETVTAEL